MDHGDVGRDLQKSRQSLQRCAAMAKLAFNVVQSNSIRLMSQLAFRLYW